MSNNEKTWREKLAILMKLDPYIKIESFSAHNGNEMPEIQFRLITGLMIGAVGSDQTLSLSTERNTVEECVSTVWEYTDTSMVLSPRYIAWAIMGNSSEKTVYDRIKERKRWRREGDSFIEI